MRVIESQYPGTCMACEEPYAVGDEIYWEKGVGAWHKDCDPPKNLKAHQRDRDKGL